MSGLRLPEGATVIGGEGGAGLVPDASTRHAHVLGVDDDGDILCVELELERLADLAREPLLHLRPPPKVVHHPVELREPYHPPRGEVGDVRPADDGQKVVLTRRVERDVPLDEHLAVAVDVVKGAAHGLVRRVEPAEDLLSLEGMDKEIAFELASRGIVTREDLAEQAVDELSEIAVLEPERAGELIMAARAHWFEDEPQA